MRKIILSLLGLITLVSCQNDEVKTPQITDATGLETFKKDWRDSKLESSLRAFDGDATCYLFSKNDLRYLLENSHLGKVRLVLGLTNGKLDLKTEGVDTNGASLGAVNSVIYTDHRITNQLNELSLSEHQFDSGNAILGQHLLNPNLAFNFINDWNTKLAENSDLSEVMSIDGERINYLSVKSEVVDAISSSSDFEYLGVLLGINAEGKLTTVLLSLDEDKNFNFLSPVSNNPEPIFGFFQPCPSCCD